VELRPYQDRAIDRALGDLAQGLRPCVVAPTGAGKTLIGSFITGHYSEPLWITHTLDLVDQTRARLPHCNVRSIQGLMSSGERPDCDVIAWDECHHAVTREWSTFMQAYPKTPAFGLTATPERGDGTALGNVFTSLVVVAQPRELIADGFLVPAEIWWPGKKMRSGQIVEPIDPWLEQARGLRTIVYGSNVEHAYDLAARWRMAGARARCVEGNMAAADRREIIAAFREGQLDVLTNCQVLTEGFDVPETECIVLACGCSFVGSYLQKVGRGMRPSPGKTRCLVLDMKGATKELGIMPHSDREYSLEGRAIRTKGGEEIEPVRHCRYCGAVFAAPGRECPRCGRHVPRPPTPAERSAKLRKLEEIQQGHPDDKRKAVYAQLVARARANNYSEKWPMVQFKVRYGHWPSKDIMGAQA
jgi:superfamily II DNA or RNA helicase